MIIIIYFHYDHFLVRSKILGAIVSFWLIIIQHFKLFLLHVRFSTLINNWEVFLFYVLDIRQNGDLNTLRSTFLILVLTFELMTALKRFDSFCAYEINIFTIICLCKKSIKFPSCFESRHSFVNWWRIERTNSKDIAFNRYCRCRTVQLLINSTIWLKTRWYFSLFLFSSYFIVILFAPYIYSLTKHLLLSSAKCNNYMFWYTYRSSVHKALQLFIG